MPPIVIDPSARTIVSQDERREGLHLAGPVTLRGRGAAQIQPGVHPLVDLRADPVDEALGDRVVIVAA